MRFNRFFLVLILGLPCSAMAGDCYFLFGYGTGEYRRSFTEKLEDRLLESDYVDGGYVVRRRSNPYQIGGGCELGRYAAVELDYFQGLRTEVATTAALCADVSDVRLCTSPVLIRRVATLEGWELSLLGRVPIGEYWSITGRLGALSGVARVTVTIPNDSINIAVSAEKRGVAPIAGLGIAYRPRPDFSFAIEHKRFDGKSFINQLVGRWYF